MSCLYVYLKLIHVDEDRSEHKTFTHDFRQRRSTYDVLEEETKSLFSSHLYSSSKKQMRYQDALCS